MSTTPSDGSTTAELGAPERSSPDADVVAASVGASVGRYVVLEEVGRGGMGRVLRAYDPTLQREVALKEVRPALFDEETTSRLVAEARAMARLSHPNVVAVYDVEELEDGGVPRLMIVMEYVPGQTLKGWLREDRARVWREIVAAFIEAGRGLVAAHTAGLLHRDFKPANVLVGSGTVKVTDFGLAKGVTGSRSRTDADSCSGEAEEGLTRAGVVLGTPRYMAPEQHAGEELTSSADQYAFCVALWEAVGGEPPFSRGNLESKKRAGPPPWPNPAVPRSVSDAVRRGLSPEPSDRWPNMQALLDALASDPAHRRKRRLLALSGVAVAAAAAGGWQSWVATRAQRCAGAEQQLHGIWDEDRRGRVEAAMLGTELPYGPRAWENAALGLDTYAEAWAGMYTEACAATTLRGEQSTVVMDLRMACLHRAKQDLEAVTGLLAEADADVVMNSHKIVSGLAEVDRCSDVASLRLGIEPPRVEDVQMVKTARGLLAKAKAELEAGRYARAQTNVDEAEVALDGVRYQPARIELEFEKGRVLDQRGKHEDAERALTGALELATARGQLREMQATASLLLYVVGYEQRRMEEALHRYRMLAQNLAADEVSRAEVLNSVAAILAGQGKFQDSEATHRQALALREKALEPGDPAVAVSRNNLALLLYMQGKYEEAEKEHRRALAARETKLGPDHPEVASSRTNLAAVLFVQGKYAASEAEQRRSLAIWKKTVGPEHPHVARSRNNLALVLDTLGEHEGAEQEHRQALALKAKTLGSEHPDVGTSHSNLANCLFAQGKYDEAEAEQRRALAIWETSGGSDHPDVALSRTNLASMLLERGRVDEAVELAEQAWSRRRREDIPIEQQAETALILARALWQTGREPSRRNRARSLAQRALELFERAGEAHRELAGAARTWLAAHPAP